MSSSSDKQPISKQDEESGNSDDSLGLPTYKLPRIRKIKNLETTDDNDGSTNNADVDGEGNGEGSIKKKTIKRKKRLKKNSDVSKVLADGEGTKENGDSNNNNNDNIDNDDDDNNDQPVSKEAQEIDNIIQRLQTKRKKRDAEDSYAVMSELADDFLQKMHSAAIKDIDAFDHKAPALEKIKFLPTVRSFFAKAAAHETLVEKGCLTEIRFWLEPFPDGSLPALDIQRTLLRTLAVLNVTDDDYSFMASSRIGRVVSFYAKYPNVTPDIQKMAQSLVDKWSRPLLGGRKPVRG